tara:strand:- start:1246 stop:1404 length:159 start_codon:yes stop_codon:yes gene_type:complete
MADNKIQMPSSQGGLVSYHDEYKSRFMIKPTTVVILIVVVVALIITLHIGLF